MMERAAQSKLLLDSLLHSRLLVSEIGGIPSFNRSLLDAVNLESKLVFSQKLGHLYEDALEILLSRSPSIEEVYRGVQVYRKGLSKGVETVGEFDFLVKTKDAWFHLELAVKFYFSVPMKGGWYWPGPDGRDHWELKRFHLLGKQLALASTSEGKKVIYERTGSSIIKRVVLVYGCLFDRVFKAQGQAHDTSSQCHRGKWMTREQFRQAYFYKEVALIPKHLWPVSDCGAMVELLGTQDFSEVLAQSKQRCTMFTDGRERYFVVSDEWLDLTSH